MATLNDPTPVKMKLNISLDYRTLTVILVVVIAGMLALWQPWNDPRSSTRTIEVTGQAKLSAVPDEFVFYPSYAFRNSDKAAALAALTKKSDELVSKLKALGVADNKIKTNSAGYSYPLYDKVSGSATYSLQLTVTVDNKDLAQKVQDYLVSTSPSGAVSPQANFSDAKRKELENKARDEATKDARSKAEQSAKNLGFSLGSVKTVNDGTGFGGIPYPAIGVQQDVAESKQLQIQPGENDLTYTVTVSYFIR